MYILERRTGIYWFEPFLGVYQQQRIQPWLQEDISNTMKDLAL